MGHSWETRLLEVHQTYPTVPEVLSDGCTSEKINFSNSVKQDCVHAPVLFSLLFTRVPLHAARNLDIGIYVRYRPDGSLFNLRRLAAKITFKKLFTEALFADNCALMNHEENHL